MSGREIRPGMQVAEMSEIVEEVVDRLVVTMPSGTIRVVPALAEHATIDAEIECDEEDPLPTISWTVESGTLAIDVQVPEATGRGTVAMTVAVPRTAPVEVTAQFARIEVEERDASLDLNTRAGSIRVRNIVGELTLRTNAGAIDVSDVRAESVLFETHAGSIVAAGVDAQYARVASQVGRVAATFVTQPRLVEATTTVGKLNVAVPVGSYAGTLSGRVKLGDGIRIAPDAEHQLDVSVTLGSARITATGT